MGLVRAFTFAGAPRVLASLWKVDDEATRVLMSRFYERWKAGAPPAAALREAQEHVRGLERDVRDEEATQATGREVRARARPFSHPAFWAAWVLWGLPS